MIVTSASFTQTLPFQSLTQTPTIEPHFPQPEPQPQSPTIQPQSACGTGFALAKSRRTSTTATTVATSSPSTTTKKRKLKSPKKKIKSWEKQYLNISLKVHKKVPASPHLELVIKKGTVDPKHVMPSEILPANACVVHCSGETGVIKGSLTVSYLGLSPQRKRKKQKKTPLTELETKIETKVETTSKKQNHHHHHHIDNNTKEEEEEEKKVPELDAITTIDTTATHQISKHEYSDEKNMLITTSTIITDAAKEKEPQSSSSSSTTTTITSAIANLSLPQTLQMNTFTFDFVIGIPRISKTSKTSNASPATTSTLRHNYLLREPRGTTSNTSTSERERQKLILVDLGSNQVIDIHLSDSQTKPGGTVTLNVSCRPATKKELEREDATLALLRTMKGTKHSSLHACIVRGRAAFVETKLLEAASSKLLRLTVSHPNEDRLRKALQWTNITRGGGEEVLDNKCSLSGCTVGQPIEGAIMDIDYHAVKEALRLYPMTKENKKMKEVELNDQWLFEQLALAAKRGGGAKGGVWFTGRHVMFSNPNRNQSPVALRSYLQRLNCNECSIAMDCLVTYVELKYSKSVSAVQINLHLDGNSCHKQHHDIYSIKQREKAGRDCTCSFKNNVATACFSIGSSRRVQLNAQRGGGDDGKSKKCCDECTGVSTKPWLNSGDLMYFNNVWNKAWTHGIPKHDVENDGPIGPRISIALLCAEANAQETFLRIQKLGFEQCSDSV